MEPVPRGFPRRLPGVWGSFPAPTGEGMCPGPPGTAVEAELHRHPFPPARRWFCPRRSRLSANGIWQGGVTDVRAGL